MRLDLDYLKKWPLHDMAIHIVSNGYYIYIECSKGISVERIPMAPLMWGLGYIARTKLCILRKKEPSLLSRFVNLKLSFFNDMVT